MNELKNYPISITEVFRARSIVQSFIKPTQLLQYPGFSKLIQADVYVKHENHNPTACFKIRGSVNLVHHLKQNNIQGVITFSTGNHGLSVATSAAWAGLTAVVVVPKNNNPLKNKAIIDTGAELIEAGKNFEEAEAVVEQLCTERGLYYVHPANEPHLINGVGSEFLEIIEDLPDIDVMIVPLGGGTEVAAAITTLRVLRPHVEIIAVQAKNSSAAYLSWKEKKLLSAENKTFAGGFATGKAYATPFEIYHQALSNFVLLTEEEIYKSIGIAFHYTHHLAEGAGASTFFAAIKLKAQLRGKKVVLQMSGSNASCQEITQALSYPMCEQGYIDNS